MSGLTSPQNIPYPVAGDPLANWTTIAQAMAEQIDDLLTGAISGFGNWQAWTPTITSETGTLTTKSGAGVYVAFGNAVFYHVSISVTTVGTGANGLRFSTPSGLDIHSDMSHIGEARRSDTGGFAGSVTRASAAVGQLYKYDGSSFIAAGLSVQASGFYKKA